jgi:deoxyribonuclease-4
LNCILYLNFTENNIDKVFPIKLLEKQKGTIIIYVEVVIMLNIGCHLSASKGYEAMGKKALEIDANTFQFFTRNPRGGKAKKIDPEDVEALLKIMQENGISVIIAHAPYTLNACSANEKTREFAFQVMTDDLKRMEYLPGNLYNFHPGSHVKQGVEVGIKYIVDMLNAILKPDQNTRVLLETMAGKGTEIGRSFEELKEILDGVTLSDKMGVCLDTCHVYDAGYDIVNDLDGVLDEFDRIIGLYNLYAVHLNDSKNPFSSHKDRHEKIGQGSIGKEAIARIINHPKLCHLPFVLETPNELSGYASEIKMLKEAYKGD